MYIFFVSIDAVTWGAADKTMFLYTKVVKSLIENYENVNQITDFWKFMEEDMLDTFYWEEMYNTGNNWKNNPCPGIRPPCTSMGEVHSALPFILRDSVFTP